MCGEYRSWLKLPISTMGSPPHVWGKQKNHEKNHAPIRITPHMCGEYTALQSGGSVRIGSPPHVWGIRNGSDGVVRIVGITPTCVGNT